MLKQMWWTFSSSLRRTRRWYERQQ